MRKLSLTTNAQKAAFDSKFAERTPNPLSPRLLAQANAIGFEVDGELVGGYLLNTEAPFRYWEKTPAPYRDMPHARAFLVPGKTVELACMWLDNRKISHWQRSRIYLSAVLDAVRQWPDWILAGSVNPKVASIHKQGFRTMVYAGPTTFPGMPYGEIYAARPLELLTGFPRAYLFRTLMGHQRVVADWTTEADRP